MVTGHAHPQNSALHADRPHPPVISNKGVLHFWPFAKYAVAFPRMSRSIFTRANSARNRLISICSTLTALLLAGPFSRPSRFALTQLYKVCSTTPRLRAAAAMLWPDSTIRTASCLNSSVYCARVAFVISVSLALLNHSARDTFCAGKVKQELRDYVARRNWTLHQVYTDKGVSGAVEKSPGLDAMMNDCRHRKVDVVIVWKFD